MPRPIWLPMARTPRRRPGATAPSAPAQETRVLLASGKTLPIDRIAVGAAVLATDPYTRTTDSRPVTNVIVHSGTHIMVAVTLAGGGTIDTTDHHPFWDASSGQFVYADALHRGDKLRESNGRDIRVAGIAIYTANVTAYNLTISGIHTYYVLAGTASVLVHNSCIVGEVAGSLYEATPARFAVDSNGTAEDLVNPWELHEFSGPYQLPPEGPMELPESRAGRWLQLFAKVLSHNWHESIDGY
jgi:hypothetical protein